MASFVEDVEDAVSVLSFLQQLSARMMNSDKYWNDEYSSAKQARSRLAMVSRGSKNHIVTFPCCGLVEGSSFYLIGGARVQAGA
jgi:hypothetical protein